MTKAQIRTLKAAHYRLSKDTDPKKFSAWLDDFIEEVGPSMNLCVCQLYARDPELPWEQRVGYILDVWRRWLRELEPMGDLKLEEVA